MDWDSGKPVDKIGSTEIFGPLPIRGRDPGGHVGDSEMSLGPSDRQFRRFLGVILAGPLTETAPGRHRYIANECKYFCETRLTVSRVSPIDL